MLNPFLLTVLLWHVRVMFCSVFHFMFSGFFELSVVSLPPPESAFKCMHEPGSQFKGSRINNTLQPQTR